MKRTLPLATTFIALGVFGVLLFAAAQRGWEPPQQNSFLYKGAGALAFYSSGESVPYLASPISVIADITLISPTPSITTTTSTF